MSQAENLSLYADRIVQESLHKIRTAHASSSSAQVRGLVREVVSDLSFEAGPERRDGIVNSALLEIVQSYISHLAKEEAIAD